MLRKIFVRLLRIDDSLSTLAQGSFKEGDGSGRIGRQFVCKLFIVGNEVGDVNVTVVLFD